MIRSAQVPDHEDRNRKAPRALGPSRSPASASMAVDLTDLLWTRDGRVWVRARQPWTNPGSVRTLLPTVTYVRKEWWQ